MKKRTIYFHKTPFSYNPKEGWVEKTEEWEVEVMAIAKKYAMVRRKGCMPFVASIKELKLIEDGVIK